MKSLNWFSSKVRLICLVENSGGLRYMDSVFIFQSQDFQTAFQRALELGRKQEEEYKNDEGNLVRWKLKEIISLDVIQSEYLDGSEVYSEPVALEEFDRYNFDQEFEPEKSMPTQTI